MKVYYAPEFVSQVATLDERTRNKVKAITHYIEENPEGIVFAQNQYRIERQHGDDYKIKFIDLVLWATLGVKDGERYWLFSSVDLEYYRL